MARRPRNGVSGHHQEPVEEVTRREGSIVKISMKDFITYDSVVVSPGHSLNVVIGPNGTGKSTILMAIVLGLGGKPIHLGKQNTNIQDFIKSHRQEAQIEIELYRHQKNTVIKRTIFKDGKSIWHLNGRQVPMRDIDAETKVLNIQVDNLCQVLAQDRVQDFAKLNKQELLEATQKAVGKEGMSSIHSELKELQKKQKLLETQLLADKKKRDIEQGHVDRLKGAVEKMEKKRGIENEAEVCKLKMCIMTYKQKFNEVAQYKNLQKDAEAAVQRVNDLIDPYRQQIATAEQNYNVTKKKQTDIDRAIRQQFETIDSSRDTLESLRCNIINLDVDMEKRLKTLENQKSQEDKVRQAISKLKNDLIGLQSIPLAEIKAKSQKLKEHLENLARQHMAAQKNKLEIDNKVKDLQNELQSVNQEIRNLQNFKQLRLRQLEVVHPHAYQAALWVDRHRDIFEKPVYLPMIVELDVEPAYARYVENAIGFNDLIAIVCESKEDMKLVVDNCRKDMKLRVNVLHADPDCPPSISKTKFENIKAKFPEFEHYLKNFVKGPNTLINFLCHAKQFHNIPVAFSDVEASDFFPVYYAGNLRKGHMKSRYSSNLIYISDSIDQARFFKQVSSQVDEDSVHKRAASIRSKMEKQQKEQNTAEEQINCLVTKRTQLREELQKIEKSEATAQAMKFQLGQKEKALNEMERKRTDPQTVAKEFSVKLKEATLSLVNAEEPFFKTLKELEAWYLKSHFLEFKVKFTRALVASAKRACKAEQEALEKAKLQLERVTNVLSELKTEARTQLNVIKTKNNNKDPSQIWKDNELIFSALPNSIEELETHIEDKIALAQMLGGTNDADVIRQFQGHVKQLESLEASIADKETEITNIVQNMETRQEQWKRELDELVDAISSNFSRSFSEMKCAGEVGLFTGNNEHDYDNYGLRVRVKFRDQEDLQDLNAHTQSGGERAVSTAIYMLSLQELTPAPFRLVDEINQGMDSKNERKVYELLLNSTCRPGTPQYFLLTPKLLKDMKYNPGTTVLCVMNSACAPSHKSWDLDRFITLRRQMGSDVTNRNGMDVDDEDN